METAETIVLDSRETAREHVERAVSELLKTSPEEAFKRLDAGRFHGTSMESEVRVLRAIFERSSKR